jgi:hypothetical protein
VAPQLLRAVRSVLQAWVRPVWNASLELAHPAASTASEVKGCTPPRGRNVGADEQPLRVPGQPIKEDFQMKMPTQANAVQRTATPTKIAAGIAPSGLCEQLCNLIGDPVGRAICLSKC